MQTPTSATDGVTDKQFVTRVRMRMPLPIFAATSRCRHVSKNGKQCGNTVDTMGLHALLCGRSGHVAQRHNAIRDDVAHLLCESQPHPVHVEPHGNNLSDDKHSDVRWRDQTSLRGLILQW
jgi:hypothetical protein